MTDLSFSQSEPSLYNHLFTKLILTENASCINFLRIWPNWISKSQTHFWLYTNQETFLKAKKVINGFLVKKRLRKTSSRFAKSVLKKIYNHPTEMLLVYKKRFTYQKIRDVLYKSGIKITIEQSVNWWQECNNALSLVFPRS